MDRRPVLRDPVADATLAEEGYTTLAFLSGSEVSGLLDTYRALVPPDEGGVQLDFVRNDRDLVRRLSKELQTALEPRIEEVFTDHWPVLTSFIVKHPGPGSDFYLHRDVPVNDERTTRCFTLWIPLVDVGPSQDNGGLGVVPRSERLPSGQFGFDASVLAEPFTDYLHTLLRPVELTAGNGLVYDGRLLHASDENRSDAPRPAIGCLLGRKSEPLTHVVPTGRRHRKMYAIDRDFFIDHHPSEIVTNGMPADSRLVDEFDEEDALPASLLLHVLGDAATPPAALTPVPADLADRGFPRRSLLRSTPAGLPAATHDIALAAVDLSPVKDQVAGARVVEVSGAIGQQPLVVAGRRAPQEPPAALPALGEMSRSRATRDLAVVALDPGSRLGIEVPRRRRTRFAVVVVDAPHVRAGMATSTASAVLEPGRAFDVDAGATCTVWNDGPGPAVVLLRRSVDLRPATRRSGSKSRPHRTGG